MDKQTDVVIIGGGQAGLSVSYSLTQQGRPHLIVEKSSSLFPAWRSRWDSFTLVTPNWFVQLPGKPYEGSDPDGFLSKREIVDYFENFVASFKPEVRFETQVTSIEKNKGGDGFLIRAGDNTILADNVVVATGTFQTPRDMSAEQSARAVRKGVEILEVLPEFSAANAEAPMRAVAEEFGLKAGQFFGILRNAVTGQEVSPPLFESMEIVGRDTVLARLKRGLDELEKISKNPEPPQTTLKK